MRFDFKLKGSIIASLFCASGMYISYRVQVRNTLCSRKYQPRARASIVRWNLKEAGGKHSSLRTGTAYRQGNKGNVAKQTKARYCTEY
ncbi:MAG: hypothetical protein ABI325_07440, partial [Ginsengibacter sp.]